MCEVNPKGLKNIVIKNGEKLLYLIILLDIYGCIEPELIWYELFALTLKDMGFVINPYDSCVVKTMINVNK